ncbi:MAG: XRE family transcriptional regulator [Gammaproteobacteria bacterium CG_4_10_14_0_8_um_filter_38_16]|nr:MAG: XRE family transcriptional regulator [Gammaproteobacteria bacterium CG_4_10_14_0_8_um_filter_38_16]PJA03186.1 MAG: XRE family transcriptional regulator [Gammaproteobacteria bacterium CG_4_10_14_0_2_um_filter_38_22]PJB10523.1 MAG: XRE family transcriptional regulator [Gammaproteobacteria bacterium CG_4_9_14_3_um_filter_38_9]
MAGSPISKRLKEARIEVGISQKQLGIKAGIDEFGASARMNQYETGKHSPDFGMLQRIAKVLKLPAAFFYTNDNCLANIIKMYSKLNDDQRHRLSKFLEKLAR